MVSALLPSAIGSLAIIHAEKSDLFDVLAYVAHALPPLTRQERAARAKLAIDGTIQQQAAGFLEFVLALRWGGCRRVGPGEADAAAAAQVSELDHRRSTFRVVV